ncbi:MAG TPA: uroporphyrinogen decarboxylase family protein, partial [Spirochaetia bacterium]|nr:uroporphyrinogen decarboxylase family protein [Spirochaetia bacterium]
MIGTGAAGRLSSMWNHEPAGIPVIITGAAQAASMAGCEPAEMRRNGSLLARVQKEFQARTGMDWLVVYADAMAVPEALGVKLKMTAFGPVGETVLDIKNFTGFDAVAWQNVASINAILEAL